jgi:hypothetical protein
MLGFVILDHICKERTERVTSKSSYGCANERVDRRHPPFEPSVHFHSKQLVAVIGAHEQKSTVVFNHDGTENGTRDACPQQQQAADGELVIE